METERLLETPTSLLAFGVRSGKPVVLKVVKSRGEEWEAGAVAAAFGGRGVVRVHEHAPGAALLQALRPGTPLVELVAEGRDEEATRILARVVREMAAADPPTTGHPTAREWGRAFDRYLESGDEQIATGRVEEARDRYAALCRTQSRPRLLHGDLQHYNVLFDDGRGWTAVDPKGVVAELEYELGAALRNPAGIPELYSSAGAVRRRVETFARELGIDADRTLAWGWAQAVLSAVWLVEDEGTVDPDGPALRLADAVQPLLT